MKDLQDRFNVYDMILFSFPDVPGIGALMAELQNEWHNIWQIETRLGQQTVFGASGVDQFINELEEAERQLAAVHALFHVDEPVKILIKSKIQTVEVTNTIALRAIWNKIRTIDVDMFKRIPKKGKGAPKQNARKTFIKKAVMKVCRLIPHESSVNQTYLAALLLAFAGAMPAPSTKNRGQLVNSESLQQYKDQCYDDLKRYLPKGK